MIALMSPCFQGLLDSSWALSMDLIRLLRLCYFWDGNGCLMDFIISTIWCQRIRGTMLYKLSKHAVFESHFFHLSSFPWHIFFQRSWCCCKACCLFATASRHPRISSSVLQLLRKEQKLRSRSQGICVLATISNLLIRERDSTKSVLPTGDISGTEAT